MNEHRPDDTSHNNDMRAKTTSSIWALTLPLMGISIPLTAITQSGIVLPLAVLGAAAISTAAVWVRGGGGGAARPSAHEIALQKQVSELEERLASLEGITNFEHRLLEAKYPNAAPGSHSSATASTPAVSQS